MNEQHKNAKQKQTCGDNLQALSGDEDNESFSGNGRLGKTNKPSAPPSRKHEPSEINASHDASLDNAQNPSEHVQQDPRKGSATGPVLRTENLNENLSLSSQSNANKELVRRHSEGMSRSRFSQQYVDVERTADVLRSTRPNVKPMTAAENQQELPATGSSSLEDSTNAGPSRLDSDKVTSRSGEAVGVHVNENVWKFRIVPAAVLVVGMLAYFYFAYTSLHGELILITRNFSRTVTGSPEFQEALEKAMQDAWRTLAAAFAVFLSTAIAIICLALGFAHRGPAGPTALTGGHGQRTHGMNYPDPPPNLRLERQLCLVCFSTPALGTFPRLVRQRLLSRLVDLRDVPVTQVRLSCNADIGNIPPSALTIVARSSETRNTILEKAGAVRGDFHLSIVNYLRCIGSQTFLLVYEDHESRTMVRDRLYHSKFDDIRDNPPLEEFIGSDRLISMGTDFNEVQANRLVEWLQEHWSRV